ncbi:MAG: WD40 repeat domain-containing protein, partial [Spirochaetota bacterium]
NLQQIKELEVHPDDIFSVAIHTGIGKLATGGRDGVIRIFDIESGNRIGLLRGHVEEIYSLEVTPDGKKLLSAGKDKTVRVWDTETGELLHVFQGHTAAVNALAIEPDGSRVISVSGDGSLRTWYLDEMYVPGFTKKISKNNMISIALTEDGKMLAYTGLVMTYDSSTEME